MYHFHYNVGSILSGVRLRRIYLWCVAPTKSVRKSSESNRKTLLEKKEALLQLVPRRFLVSLFVYQCTYSTLPLLQNEYRQFWTHRTTPDVPPLSRTDHEQSGATNHYENTLDRFTTLLLRLLPVCLDSVRL